MYLEKSLKDYLDDLAARKPTPGGGSAAALTGALGASLLSMVANFTTGKEKFKELEKEMKKILSSTEQLRKRLLELVDLDVMKYKEVCNVRSGTKRQLTKALKEAAEVAKQIEDCSEQALKLSFVLEKRGNVNLISDVRAAQILLKASIKSAAEFA